MKGAERGEVIISKEVPESDVTNIFRFFKNTTSGLLPDCEGKDYYSRLIRGVLRVQRLERGRLTCLSSPEPPVLNIYKTLHGGAVAAITELVSIACARTVVAEDKELFLGELSLSYLSSAPAKEEVVVDASVVRSGRNVTVVAVELKMKKTSKLVYIGRATFYNMPLAKL